MTRRSLMLALGAATAACALAGEWRTEGFEAFRRGTFGNAGHNLYVSRAGVLQRIFQYDLDHNGWFDLVFANCQDHHESAPSYVYDLASGRRTVALKGQGARSGAVADLNGDGIDDIVVTGYFDMVTPFACAEIYYGGEDGSYGERRHVRLQAPRAVDTAVGRFDGGKLPSVAFAMPTFKVLRVCHQTKLGFEWKSFTDLPLEASVIAAGDFDGDGFDDLACRTSESTASTVLWGSAKGLQLDARTDVKARPASEYVSSIQSEGYQSEFEKEERPPRLMDSVVFNGKPCFSLSTGRKLILYSSGRDRVVRPVLELPVEYAVACATGDFNADGLTDIAIAREKGSYDEDDRQRSWIWINSSEGFRKENILEVGTRSASSVCARNGKILFGQAEAGGRYTNDALLFSFEHGRLNPTPRRFEGEDMRQVFLFNDAAGAEKVLLVNRYARGSLGFDKTYVYWGRDGRYAAGDRTEVPCWCAVDSVCADLDDDGWAELMVCNNSENSLHLDKGHHVHHFGPKGFDPSRSFTLKTDVGWGAMVADFNRDGYLDVFTVCDMWSSLAMFEGGPDGFKRTYDCLLFPEDPADAAKAKTASAADSSRKWHLKRETFGSLRWPVAVDVNNDGWLDVASGVGPVGGAFVLWGGPQGFNATNRQDLAAHFATGVRAADLDGNGYPELIFGGHCSQPSGKDAYRQPHHSYLHVYWNGPEGISDSRKSMLRTDAASNLCVGDFDGNGWLDVYACSYQGDLDRDINSFIYWNREGQFDPYDRQDLVTHSGSGCLAVDFNEDGRLDLAVANHKIFGDHRGYSEVWWNTDEGFLPTRTTKLPTCGPHGMTVIEPGNVLTRGPEEYYTSEPYVAGNDLVVESVIAEGEVPAKCWVKAMVRSDGGPWREPAGFKVKRGSRLQYRLALGAVNSLRSPRIRAVRVRFSDAPAAEPGKEIVRAVDGSLRIPLTVTASPVRRGRLSELKPRIPEAHRAQGDRLCYGLSGAFQVGPTTAAILLERNVYTTEGQTDFEDGSDIVTFDSLDGIASAVPIPAARSGIRADPNFGGENRYHVNYGLWGGFVPFGAKCGGDAHPHAGTGFAIAQIISLPIATNGIFSWKMPGKSARWTQLSELAFDGKRMEVRHTRFYSASDPLKIGGTPWRFLFGGLGSAIPDGSDLLLPSTVQRGETGVVVCGVTRWRRGEKGWRPVDFLQVPKQGFSEPSLIRLRDGALVFSGRDDRRPKPGDPKWRPGFFFSQNLHAWISRDGGMTWRDAVHLADVRCCTPVSIGRANDGTPYFVANPCLGLKNYEDSRNRLALWPMTEDLMKIGSPIKVRDAQAEFASGTKNWMMDHPTTSVLRLADGKIHSILSYRVRDWFRDSSGRGIAEPSKEAGVYVEEVTGSGEPLPMWNF